MDDGVGSFSDDTGGGPGIEEPGGCPGGPGKEETGGKTCPGIGGT